MAASGRRLEQITGRGPERKHEPGSRGRVAVARAVAMKLKKPRCMALGNHRGGVGDVLLDAGWSNGCRIGFAPPSVINGW